MMATSGKQLLTFRFPLRASGTDKGEEQLQLAYAVIQDAFNTSLSSDASTISTLRQQLAQKNASIAELRKSLNELEEKRLAVREVNTKLEIENTAIAQEIARLAVFAAEYNSLKATVQTALTPYARRLPRSRSQFELQLPEDKVESPHTWKHGQYRDDNDTAYDPLLENFPAKGQAEYSSDRRGPRVQGTYNGLRQFAGVPGLPLRQDTVTPPHHFHPESDLQFAYAPNPTPADESAEFNCGPTREYEENHNRTPQVRSQVRQQLPPERKPKSELIRRYKSKDGSDEDGEEEQEQEQEEGMDLDMDFDWKLYFDIVRERLTHENFVEFVQAMKAHKLEQLSPDELTSKVKQIFGEDNEDLFLNFQSMLAAEAADYICLLTSLVILPLSLLFI